jgi:hypothetical protein
MKETRAALSLLIFIISVHISFLLPQSSQSLDVTAGYAPTTCPGALNDARATLLLPTTNQKSKYLSSLRSDFNVNRSGTLPLTRGAVVIAGDARSSLELQSKTGKWTSATSCYIGAAESWFVGGSAGITSQSKLVMDNSGLSDATVEVTTFSENGPGQPVSYTIKAASEKVVRLDALSPGAGKIVTKVKVLSGRVTPFLLDERVKGLNNLGGDFVAPQIAPASTIVIPALPSTLGRGSSLQHVLRIMATGTVDGTASVEIVSSNGVIVPVDLGEIALNSQEVVEVPLNELEVGQENFGLRITATTPIVAGVFVQGKKGALSDFSWHSASTPFQSTTFNLYGLEPILTFISEKISVSAQWRDNRGKSFSKTLKGEEIVNWKVPANVRLLTLTSFTGTIAGMTWSSQDGIATLPVTAGSSLSSATRPIAEISVIQPRH